METLQNKLLIFIIIIFASLTVNAQQLKSNEAVSDSLDLQWIIQEVIKNHPLVKSAEEALKSADAQIGLAKSGYYPNINFDANINNIGPVPSLSLPDMGTFSFVPRNNISGEFSLHQSIYDFGKTAQGIAVADEGKSITEQSKEQVKQKLALHSVQIYYNLDFLQEAIKIKAEQLQTLNEHLDFVEKKKATGSATDYEVLSTKVKISGVESQLLDIKAARKVQLSALNSLLGLPSETFHNVKQLLDMKLPVIESDSMISHAYANRNEMMIAKKKEQLASMQVEMEKIKKTPSLYFIANGGIKNGFVPEINKIRPNYVVGLGVNIPIFDGTREKYNIVKAQSAAETTVLQTEVTRRDISSEVVESEARIQTAVQKVTQSKLQLEQAEEALSLAKLSYQSGVITNLDLLDAATAVSESRLLLLKSQIDYVVNIYNLNASLGEKLY